MTSLQVATFAAILCIGAGAATAQVASVTATVETDPAAGAGDAADDPAVWVHPTDAGASLVLGTDKLSGLFVYDVDGGERQFLPGAVNNVDVIYQFPLGGRLVDLAVASRITDGSLAVWRIDPATLRLEDVAAGTLSAGIPVYGICLYRSPSTGLVYAIVNSKPGAVRQFELFDDGTGRVAHRLVRSFALASEVEGCVADADAAHLYIGEENRGIWRYGAEPSAGTAAVAVDATRPEGPLVADVEGLAIYYGPGTTGYLLASSQGSNEYVVYRREPPNAYVGRFRIADGPLIDGTEGTDGIDVSHAPLGPAFPSGVFLAQDNDNEPDRQNFKLVPWPAIATAMTPDLIVSTARPVRSSGLPRCANGVDDDGDGASDYPDDAGCSVPYAHTEAPACDDGADNDGDGRIDFGVDPQCASAWDPREAAGACGLGAELAPFLVAVRWLRRHGPRGRRRADRRDPARA